MGSEMCIRDRPISLSIIGCVVNGPGEALMTDIGLTGGGAGTHMVYGMGKTSHTVRTEEMVEHIVGLVEARAARMKAAKEAEKAAEAAPKQAAE